MEGTAGFGVEGTAGFGVEAPVERLARRGALVEDFSNTLSEPSLNTQRSSIIAIKY